MGNLNPEKLGSSPQVHKVEPRLASTIVYLFVFSGLAVNAVATPYADLVLNSRLTAAHLSSSVLSLFPIAVFRALFAFPLWCQLIVERTVFGV